MWCLHLRGIVGSNGQPWQSTARIRRLATTIDVQRSLRQPGFLYSVSQERNADCPMHDLNDLYYFTQVVEHGGFAPAARTLGVAKSKLSRRVAALEERLGVRLLQRSTRRFSVTEIGQEYHRHCVAMLVEAEGAQEVIDRVVSEPSGSLLLSCSPGLLQWRISAMLGRFMTECPQVRISVDATNRHVDVISEGFDLALRVRFPPVQDSDLIARTLGHDAQHIVASPALVARMPAIIHPADLSRWPSLDFGPLNRKHAWILEGPNAATAEIPLEPRLITDDLNTLRDAALAGIGIVLLPGLVVHDDIAQGRLRVVLPGWHAQAGIIQAVFPSRRGLIPAVRRLIDFLATEFENDPGPIKPSVARGKHAAAA